MEAGGILFLRAEQGGHRYFFAGSISLGREILVEEGY